SSRTFPSPRPCVHKCSCPALALPFVIHHQTIEPSAVPLPANVHHRNWWAASQSRCYSHTELRTTAALRFRPDEMQMRSRTCFFLCRLEPAPPACRTVPMPRSVLDLLFQEAPHQSFHPRGKKLAAVCNRF